MSKKVEFKSFEFKVDEASDDGKVAVIKGYASTFGNVDFGMDVVDKGAFKKSIKENGGKWPILADHSPEKPVGYNVSAKEDDTGLYVEFELNLEVQIARERYSLAKQAQRLGTNMGLSIGYMTIKAEPDREKPMVRRLKELKLFEHSLVTFPMNDKAMVTHAKGLGGIDGARYIIEQLKTQGITPTELSLALQETEAAPESLDPAIGQSIDQLIAKMRE